MTDRIDRVRMARILVVDDDLDVCSVVSDLIAAETPHLVEGTTSPMDALARHKQQPFDVVITDVKMPVMNGLMLIQKLKSISPDTRVILFSGHYSADVARGAGAFDFLQKPVNPGELLAVIARAVAES